MTFGTTYVLNEILNALNNKLMTAGIFWDLEKSFDSVNHDILLSQSFMEYQRKPFC